MDLATQTNTGQIEKLIDRLRKHHQKSQKAEQPDLPEQEREQLLAELANKSTKLASELQKLHPADIAIILDALPKSSRTMAWEWLPASMRGEVFFALNNPARKTLLEAVDMQSLVTPLAELELNEIAIIAPQLPDSIIKSIEKELDEKERELLKSVLAYDETQVGSLIDFDQIALRGDVTVAVALRYLRRLKDLPDHTDKLFIVDHDGHWLGVLRLRTLVTSKPDKVLSELMDVDVPAFKPQDEALEAAQAFDRYDLFSAPVIDDAGKLIGRLTVDEMLDQLRKYEDQTQLAEVGVKSEEDIFAPVTRSIRNRSPWLAINLVTALVASQVIGLFEGSIEQLVVLAALMPIVAGMGGNVGNQSITMIVRELSARALTKSDIAILYGKELKIGLINGLIWGSVLGLVIFLLYQNPPLSAVIMGAMTLNFLSAAFFGVTIPVIRAKLGRDPALGSSVMITAITDSGGFFIFLGMATIFLL